MKHLSSPLVLSLSVALSALFIGSGPSVRAAELGDYRRTFVTADFARVARVARHLGEKYEPGDVLLVLDIDNTLLAMDQDLGSDQWFGWQRDLQKSNPESSKLVAPDFVGLLEAQGLLFALSRMHPPEPDLPDIVRGVQQLGVRTLVLTSRGPAFRDATERELAKNGYEFENTALEITEKRGPFAPFDVNEPQRHGLTAKEAAAVGTQLRPVSYSRGVFMVSGQHKGYMLRSLLARVPDGSTQPGYRPKAIVFVDDRQRHVDDVAEAFASWSLDLVTCRYSREDGNVERFRAADKERTARDWNALEEAIRLALPRRTGAPHAQGSKVP